MAIPVVGKNVEELVVPQPAGWNEKWHNHCGGNNCLEKLSIYLPYYLALPLLDICPKEMEVYVHTKTCTQMFISAFFVIDKKWKQPKCPPVDECIDKLWYIQIMCSTLGVLLSNKKKWIFDVCYNMAEF